TEEPPAPEPEKPRETPKKETESFLPKAGTQILSSLPYLGGGILVAALALLNRKKLQQLFQKMMNRK
ncbi:LPXTG cell wall anchor domain-containing protein, partial [Enterococcus cecorum]